MQFAHPNLLWLIPVVAPALIVFFWWSARRRRVLLTAFINSRLLPGLLSGVSEGRQRLRAACIIAAGCLCIVALARPQWGFTWEEVKQRGLDIVVAIDVSKSMLATDIQPSRLGRAKLAAVDLMRRAQSDRLGLVVFAGSAFLQCPLTIDDSVFRQSVEGLDVQSLSKGGTAISEAIETAMSAFTEGENYKVLVLLTDGEDQDSGALDTATEAVKKGLEIFTIGIGTPEGEMVQVKDASGKVDFVRDENGNVVKSRLNETLLRELAGLSTRGFYLPLRGAKAIDTLYEQGLAPIPKSEAGEKLVKRYFERYHWPLGAALALLIFEMLFPERRNRPAPGPSKGSKPAAATATTALLLFLATNATATPGSAARAYQEGDYKKALREYKEALQKRKDDPRLHFNAGNAAYRSKQLEEAANQFNAALSARDLELQQRAFYNRGNTFYAMGEGTPDPQQKATAWERSLKDFEAALKLNPKDADAAHNRDLVKRRLEELKQQQQQKNDQNKDENKEQEQNQDNQEQKQDQKEQDQQKQDQQQQKQEQQNKEDQQQNQKSDQQKEQEKQEQQSGQDQKKEEQQQESGQKNEQGPEDQRQQQAQQAIPGQMTPEQARQLLDAQKDEEKILQFRPEEKPVDGSRPMRDW